MFVRGHAVRKLGLVTTLAVAGFPQLPADPAAIPNDNRAAAGRRNGDTLVLQLVAVKARWFILGDSNPAFSVAAFAEEGKRPSVPGPLLRVHAGTVVHAIVRNSLPDTLIVRGLGNRGIPDSLVVVPGESGEARFTATRVGTFHYWAVTSGARRLLAPAMQASNGLSRAGFDSQLAGAFIVDPPGYVVNDRVFVITELADQERSRLGDPNRGRHGTPPREFTALNGRSWPFTERLRFAVGDTVRWRIVNASLQPHPMHLHGFYFRVDSRATPRIDSVFTPDQQRMAVTETVITGGAMSIIWSPDRPGGWIFHCHLTQHAVKLPPVDQPDSVQYPSTHQHGDPDQHVLGGMNGLVLGMTVTAPSPGPDTWRPARRLRLFVQSDSTPADSMRRFGFVLQEGAEPRRDSVRYPGSVLVLQRGQPTSIEVINRMAEPTAVHWHGIELESYYDGAVGWSGAPTRTAPAIQPGGSFEVRITPKRAGTFMYHTHFDELRQQYGGLVGALIVLEPGERWDPARDLVFVLSDGVPRRIYVNGSLEPPPIDLRVGTMYRIRFADIAVDRPGLQIRLFRPDSSLVSWQPIARDGFELPASESTPRPAATNVPSGVTADFSFTPDAAGDLELRFLPGQGVVRFRVSPRSR
jgi:FtsP/CotA-like multicopper oxidase with cupredoxin domain